MKKIFNIIPFMAVAIALASCNSTMDDKEEIDAKYAVGEPPAVAITSANGGSSAVTVVGALSDPSKAIEVGVRISASEDMADAAIWPAAEVAAEFTAVAKRLEPLSTYYIQAYSVAKDNQTTYSAVQKVQTGDPEFGKAQLSGTYVGEVTDIWGEGTFTYTSVTIEFDEEDSTKCVVNNLDPYFASYGYVAPDYNAYEGVVDWENKTITIEGGQATGYGEVAIVGLDEAAENLDDIYIDILSYGEQLVVRNMYGVMSSEGWWECYPAGVALNKK